MNLHRIIKKAVIAMLILSQLSVVGYAKEEAEILWSIEESFHTDDKGVWETDYSWSTVSKKQPLRVEKCTEPVPVSGDSMVVSPSNYPGYAQLPSDGGRILEFYMYDPEPESKTSRACVGFNMPASDESKDDMVLVGVLNTATKSSYGCRIKGTWYLSQETRSLGWHKFRIDYSYGDDVVVTLFGKADAQEVIYDSREDTANKERFTDPVVITVGNMWGGGNSKDFYFDDIKAGNAIVAKKEDISLTQSGDKISLSCDSIDLTKSTYIWQVEENGEFTTIPDATSTEIEVTRDYAGKSFRVIVNPVSKDVRQGAAVVSDTITDTVVVNRVPKLSDVKLTKEGGEYKLTFEKIAAEISGGEKDEIEKVEVRWSYSDSEKGVYTPCGVNDAIVFSPDNNSFNKYIKVQAVPVAKSGTRGAVYTVVVKDESGVFMMFSNADSKEEVFALLESYARDLDAEDKWQSLMQYEKELLCDYLIGEYSSDEQVKERIFKGYKEIARYDQKVYTTLLEDGFEDDGWTVENNKIALIRKESPLARDGKYVASVLSSESGQAEYMLLPQTKDIKVSVYFYDNMAKNGAVTANVAVGAYTPLVGVRTLWSKDNYILRIAQEAEAIDTQIPRKEGWHRIEWDFGCEKNLIIALDNNVIYDSRNTAEKDSYSMPDRIRIGNLWGGEMTSEALFDALQVVKCEAKPIMTEALIKQDKEKLSVSGNFFDASGKQEGKHIYKWYSAVDEKSEFGIIEGANGDSIQIANTDSGNCFYVEIIPVNSYGVSGDTIKSDVYTESYFASLAPMVSELTVTGDKKANSSVSVGYVYTPVNAEEGSAEDKEAVEYQWYCGADENGTYKLMENKGASYKFGLADSHLYFKVGVRVKSLDGYYSKWHMSKPFMNDTDAFYVIKNASRSELKEIFPRYIKELGLTDIFDDIDVATEGMIYADIAGIAYSSADDLEDDIEKIIGGNKIVNVGSGGSGGGGSSSRGSFVGGVEYTNVVDIHDKTPTFSDVTQKHWASKAILKLTADGYLKGKGDGSFCPDESVTRAEFITMLVRCFSLSGGEENRFGDIKEEDWYYSYVNTASALGIVSGDTEGFFNPNMPISREEMAAMLYRCIYAKGISLAKGEETDFVDGETVSYYAQEAVSVLKANKIVNGFEDGTFMPKSPVTRAMAAQVIYTVLQK